MKRYLGIMITLVAMSAAACSNDNTTTAMSTKAVEPVQHPEPAEWPEPSAPPPATATDNTGGLESAYDQCVRSVWNSLFQQCEEDPAACPQIMIDLYQALDDLCGSKSRNPNSGIPEGGCFSGSMICFGICVCNACGWVMECESDVWQDFPIPDEYGDPHGPGSGPECETCHGNGSPHGALSEMDLRLLLSTELEDFFPWSPPQD